MVWRQMTAEEMVSRPEARLEGSLLLIVVCAAILGVAAVIVLLATLVAVAAALVGRPFGGIFAVDFNGPAALGLLYAIPLLYVMGWALVFSIMALGRSPAAPGFAAGGIVGWAGLRLVIAVAGQALIMSRYDPGPGMILQSILPVLLGVLGEAMLVAGFWVYMREGVRPNAYFRRRVPL